MLDVVFEVLGRALGIGEIAGFLRSRWRRGVDRGRDLDHVARDPSRWPKMRALAAPPPVLLSEAFDEAAARLRGLGFREIGVSEERGPALAYPARVFFHDAHLTYASLGLRALRAVGRAFGASLMAKPDATPAVILLTKLARGAVISGTTKRAERRYGDIVARGGSGTPTRANLEAHLRAVAAAGAPAVGAGAIEEKLAVARAYYVARFGPAIR